MFDACPSRAGGDYQDGYETGKFDGKQDGYYNHYKGSYYNPERGTRDIDNPSLEFKRGYDEGYNNGFSEEVLNWKKIEQEANRIYDYQCPECKQHGATKDYSNYFRCVNCNNRFWVDL